MGYFHTRRDAHTTLSSTLLPNSTCISTATLNSSTPARSHPHRIAESMAAATAGYRAIGETPAPAPLADCEQTAANRMQAVAQTAGAAAVGAKDAVAQLLTAPMPEVNLYTEPLKPSAQLTIKDRVQLVCESCRPWLEFVDIKAFNVPPASEAKLRIGHNVESFFYNYLVIGFAVLALHSLFHPIRAFLLGLTVLAAVLLYIIFPEDYVINDNISITKGIKHALMAVLTLLVLTVGHVFSLLLLVVFTILPIVLVHAFLREHSASVPSAI